MITELLSKERMKMAISKFSSYPWFAFERTVTFCGLVKFVHQKGWKENDLSQQQVHNSAGSAGHIQISPGHVDTELLKGKWVKIVLGIRHFQICHQTLNASQFHLWEVRRLKICEQLSAQCGSCSKNPERYLYCIVQ